MSSMDMVHSHGEPAIPSILVVTEATSPKDESDILTSPLGMMFRGWLTTMGINPARCQFAAVLTNTSLSDALTSDKALAVKGMRQVVAGKYLRESYYHHFAHLWRKVNAIAPNVIIALGDLSLAALTEEKSLKFARGRICAGNRSIPNRKVLPTWSPQQVMDDYTLRPIVLADLAKALRESVYPELRRPQRFLHLEPSLLDLEAFYETYIKDAPDLSVDIETKGTMITCVGFAPSADRALVIPFFDETSPTGNYWSTAEEERLAWQFVRRILKEKRCFGQNFQYDMQYLWRQMGIPCPGFCDDTMLMHHALQPEMEKGLGFLASVYTDEMAWKFMHKVASADKTAKPGDVE